MALGRVFKLFIHLFYCGPCGVSVAAHRLSSAEASRGCSLAVVCRLLISVAFPAAEHRLQSAQASVLAAGRLSRWGDRLSCSTACGVFPDQGLNPWPLHWQVDSLSLSHWGCPLCAFYVHGDLAEFGEEGAEPSWFLLGMRSTPQGWLLCAQHPRDPQLSQSDCAVLLWLVIISAKLCASRGRACSAHALSKYPTGA